jgi:hypothetical protein
MSTPTTARNRSVRGGAAGAGLAGFGVVEGTAGSPPGAGGGSVDIGPGRYPPGLGKSKGRRSGNRASHGCRVSFQAINFIRAQDIAPLESKVWVD